MVITLAEIHGLECPGQLCLGFLAKSYGQRGCLVGLVRKMVRRVNWRFVSLAQLLGLCYFGNDP